MVASPLVESTIHEGARLIGELDEAGLPVSAAFWMFTSESAIWRLVIATRLFDELGPMECYKRLQKILFAEPHEIALSDLTVVSPTEEVVQLIRKAVTTGPALAGIRFTGNSVNGVFIEDAYIYRMT